jgi:CheY-like chemotaxis protein
MVYGFARQSGGACTIVSKPGVGTTVTLYFPLVADAIAELAQPVTGAPPEGDGTRILVVEDDPDVRFIVVEMLRDLGYEVEEVESAVEGLERVKRGAFGLVFSDVVLPGGMDGAELGREIRSIRPELPVLLTSGYPREALADREGIESVELLPKPFDRATLAEAISRALEAGTTPGT